MQHKDHGSLAHVRHRAASGRLDESWEYDPQRKVLIIRLSIGADVIDLDLPVCSQRHPQANRWIVIRRGADHWTLSPTLWPRDNNLLARAYAFDERLPVGSIELLGAPDNVQNELALLETAA